MAIDWSNKEKIALLSDIMEFGDQPESWSAISNDLSKTFQTRKEGRYSIKNCKQIYKYLLDSYKSEWTENNSTNHLKVPLVKFIWTKLKLVYQNEITDQLKENRKKLQEFYLQFQSSVHLKNNSVPSTPTTSTIEVQSQQQKDQLTPVENEPSTENEDNQPIPMQTDPIESTDDNEQPTTLEHIEIKEEKMENLSSNEIFSEKDHSSSSIPIEPSSSSSSTNPLLQDLPPTSSPSIPSNSSSRTNSETKTENIRVISTTTPKYHVYFSPKNSINAVTNSTKPKVKRKGNEDLKDDLEQDNSNPNDISPSPEQTKNPSGHAPVTRRSVSTRSVPNLQAEQEEENSRRFSAMIGENPNSWEAQSMAIVQFLLTHKQGYFFEHEITDEIAPKYHRYVRHPIALDTIRKNLESNHYPNKDYFKKDIYLMLYNAMKYNPRQHHVHRSAKHLFNLALPLFELSAQDIQSQVNTKPTLSSSTSQSDHPSAKRKRIK